MLSATCYIVFTPLEIHDGLDWIKLFYAEVIHASRAVLAAKTIVSHIKKKAKEF